MSEFHRTKRTRPSWAAAVAEAEARGAERSWSPQSEGPRRLSPDFVPSSDLVSSIQRLRSSFLHPPASSHGLSGELALRRRQLLEISHALSEFDDNWDEAGSRAFTEKHWRRVYEFLDAAMEGLWIREGKLVDLPTISPVSESSIDVHWRTETAELLINVPEDENSAATFYADNYGKRSVKGTVELNDGDYGLLVWLGLAK
jgi:hypothetical protein